MMVYIFGDLRQLRKFELSRPPISRPQVLSNPRHRPTISPPFSISPSGPIVQPIIIPIPQPVRLGTPPQPLRLNIPPYPQSATIHELPRARSLSSSGSSAYNSSSDSASISSSSSEGHSHDALTIEIGPAFYDDSHIEGPATGSPSSPSSTRYYSFPSKHSLDSKSRILAAEFTPTASFIHPYDPLCDEDFDGARELSPEERQGMAPFDFDLLPKRGYTFPARDRVISAVTTGTIEAPSMAEQDSGNALSGLRYPREVLGRVQHKCTKRDSISADPSQLSTPQNSPCASPRRPVDPVAQFKVIRAVPAFASPFTRVLNPVVTRAQWEIVVRSAGVAGVICWTFVGSLLAIPVSR
jgi:hypothetical protein